MPIVFIKMEQSRVRTVLNIAALLLALSALSAAQSKTPVLDLTRPLAQSARDGERPLGVPGAGLDSSKSIVKYELPLSILIISVRPRDDNTSVVRVALRNTGPTPFSIPVGRDSNKLLAQGNRARRSLLFAVNVVLPHGGALDVGHQDLTTSSLGESSVFRLDPGQEIVILLPAHLSALQEKTKSLQLSVEVPETKFEDAEYRIADRSKVVRSNRFRVGFKPPQAKHS
jgi:hypothetical protein